MQIRFKILFSFLFLCTLVQAQSDVLDSIRLATSKGVDDTSEVRNYLNMGEAVYLTQPDSAFVFWSKAQKLALNYLKKEEKPQKRKMLLLLFASANNNLGYWYHLNGEPILAIKLFEKSIAVETALGKNGSAAETRINLAFEYQAVGQIEKSLVLLHQAIKELKAENNLHTLSYALNNLGQIYHNQGEYKSALEQYRSCLDLQHKIKDSRGEATVLNNIGFVYKEMNMCDSGIKYYNNALAIREKIDDKAGQAQTLINITTLLASCNKEKNIKLYMDNLTKASLLCEEAGDQPQKTSALISLAYYHMVKKNYHEAERFALEAHKIAEKLKLPLLIGRSSERLYHLYKETQQHQKAMQMYELFISMKDSINNTTTKKASIKSQLKYEYEKKAAADSVKAVEEKKVVDAQLKQEKTQRLALYGGLGLVGIFALFMVNRFRVTSKQKKLIEEQKKVVESQKYLVEEKQKEILDSIHYAKRIQTALITNEHYINLHIERLKT